MDFYHWWIYKNILNSLWFNWTIVIVVFAMNLLAPILIWFTINSRVFPLLGEKRKEKKQQSK